MNKTVKHLYGFGPFVLDPGERLLLHGAARMELPPRAFDTLLVLVENNGRLLEKDALMRTVWRDTVVEENNLSQVVYLLRKALRDGEDGSRYIETVSEATASWPRYGKSRVKKAEVKKAGVKKATEKVHG